MSPVELGGLSDRECDGLVDALVEAVDVGRYTSIERLRHVLTPLGLVERFDAELRLNGVVSCCSQLSCVDPFCGGL